MEGIINNEEQGDQVALRTEVDLTRLAAPRGAEAGNHPTESSAGFEEAIVADTHNRTPTLGAPFPTISEQNEIIEAERQSPGATVPKSSPNRADKGKQRRRNLNPAGFNTRNAKKNAHIAASIKRTSAQQAGERDAAKEMAGHPEEEEPPAPFWQTNANRNRWYFSDGACVDHTQLNAGRHILAIIEDLAYVVGLTLKLSTGGMVALVLAMLIAPAACAPFFDFIFDTVIGTSTAIAQTSLIYGFLPLQTFFIIAAYLAYRFLFVCEHGTNFLMYRIVNVERPFNAGLTDNRHDDLRMGRIKYIPCMGTIEVMRGSWVTVTPLLQSVIARFAGRNSRMHDFVDTRGAVRLRVDLQKLFHIIGPRNGLCTDPESIPVRVISAVRSQTAHPTDRYQVIEGEESVLVRFCIRWLQSSYESAQYHLNSLNLGLVFTSARETVDVLGPMMEETILEGLFYALHSGKFLSVAPEKARFDAPTMFDTIDSPYYYPLLASWDPLRVYLLLAAVHWLAENQFMPGPWTRFKTLHIIAHIALGCLRFYFPGPPGGLSFVAITFHYGFNLLLSTYAVGRPHGITPAESEQLREPQVRTFGSFMWRWAVTIVLVPTAAAVEPILYACERTMRTGRRCFLQYWFESQDPGTMDYYYSIWVTVRKDYVGYAAFVNLLVIVVAPHVAPTMQFPFLIFCNVIGIAYHINLVNSRYRSTIASVTAARHTPGEWTVDIDESPVWVPQLNLFQTDSRRVMYGYGLPKVPPSKHISRVVRWKIKTRRGRTTQPVAVSIGPTCDAAYPRPTLNDVNMAMDSIIQRLATSAPDYDEFALEDLRQTSKWLIEQYRLSPLPSGLDYDFDHWLDNTDYSAARRNQIRDAYDAIHLGCVRGNVHTDPVAQARSLELPTLDWQLGEEDWERVVTGIPRTRVLTTELSKPFRLVKMHIKDESYSQYKPARAICARVDAAKALEGPLFHAIEKSVFSLECFAKTVPLSERGEFMERIFGTQFNKYRYLAETDYSRYESHFTEEFIDAMEFELYAHMVSCNGLYMAALAETIAIITGDNEISWKQALTVYVRAIRMSGEMNTSLGNGWGNIVLAHAAFNRLRAEPKLLTAIFEGDDGLILVEPDEYIRVPTETDFSNLGFRVKLEYRPNLQESLFCGTVKSSDSSDTLYNPNKFMLNFGWSKSQHVHFSEKKRLALLRVKALSFAYMFPSCPVVWILCRLVLRQTGHLESLARRMIDSPSFTKWEKSRLREIPDQVVTREPTPDQRLVVERVFGMTIEEQLYYESYIQANFSLNMIIPLIRTEHPDQDDFHNFCVVERGIVTGPRGAFVPPPADTRGDYTNFQKYSGTIARPPYMLNLLAILFWLRGYIAYPPTNKLYLSSKRHYYSRSDAHITSRMYGKRQKKAKQATAHAQARFATTAGELATLAKLREIEKHPIARVLITSARNKRDIRARAAGRRGAAGRAGAAGAQRPKSRAMVVVRHEGGGGRHLERAIRRGKGRYGFYGSKHGGPGGNGEVGTLDPDSGYILGDAAPSMISRGNIEVPHTIHNSLSSYEQAVEAPVAVDGRWAGDHYHEHSMTENGSNVVLFTGRQYIGNVTSDSDGTMGGLLLPPFAIDPESLGGRAALLGESFQQHRMIRMVVVYVPAVGTQTAGSLAIAFSNDVTQVVPNPGTETIFQMNNMKYASTAIWSQDLRLKVHPSDVNKEYLQGNMEAAWKAQGQVYVLSTSALAASTSFGSLYIDYELRFEQPTLTPSAINFYFGTIGFNIPNGYNTLDQTAVFGMITGGGAFDITVGNTTGISTTDLTKYYFALCGQTVSPMPAAVTDPEHTLSVQLTEGQPLYGRVFEVPTAAGTNPFFFFVLFWDLNSCMSAVRPTNYAAGAPNFLVGTESSQVLWDAAGAFAAAATITWSARAVPITDF